MTKTRLALIGLFATASIAGATVGAHAQIAAQRSGEGRGDRPAAGRNFDPAARQAQGQQRQGARTKALHDILAITPSQESAWRAFQSATETPARGDGQRPDRAALAGLTTPQRLDRMVAEATQRRDEVVARANATKTFYAQLSASQQKAFDALPGAGGERGMRGPGGRGGRGGRGGDQFGQRGPGGPGGFGEGRGPGRGGPRGEGPAA